MSDDVVRMLMRGTQPSNKPELRSYEPAWHDRIVNALTNAIYGENANAQQRSSVNHIAGPENPLNVPAQLNQGYNTAKLGADLRDPAQASAGVAQMLISGAPLGGSISKVARLQSGTPMVAPSPNAGTTANRIFSGEMPSGYRARGETDSIGRTNYDIEKVGRFGGLFGNSRVGTAYVRDLGDNVQIGRIAIDDGHTRKGIGSALYGQIEKDLGKPLVPDGVLSDAAYNFWKKHKPEAVANYTEKYGSWSPARGY